MGAAVTDKPTLAERIRYVARGIRLEGDHRWADDVLAIADEVAALERDPTDFTDYDGPRGGEAAAELAHTQAEARKLK